MKRDIYRYRFKNKFPLLSFILLFEKIVIHLLDIKYSFSILSIYVHIYRLIRKFKFTVFFYLPIHPSQILSLTIRFKENLW